MKYLRLLNILPISLFICALLALPAIADTHGMTGNISKDWGVNLQKAYAEDLSKVYTDPNGWIPKSSNVDWIAENNIDSNYNVGDYSYGGTDLFVWAGSRTGTHLQKIGSSSSISPYKEGLIYCTYQSQNYIQPAGGEPFDSEAMYFDDDSQYVYIAIITSLNPQGTGDYKPGDIGIDLDNNAGTIDETKDPSGGYEYGIKTTGTNKGLIRYKPTWSYPNDFQESTPCTFDESTGDKLGGNPKGTADVKVDCKFQDVTDAYPEAIEYLDNSHTQSSPNYIIELKIPRSVIGNPTKGQLANIHITCGCGNDNIELNQIEFKSDIPEFPSIVLPVAAIMGIILILDRRNKK